LQFLLQQLELVAHGGWHHVQHITGAGDALGIDHGNQVSELAQFHVRSEEGFDLHEGRF